MAERAVSVSLDLERFRSIIDEYSSSFQNSPRNTKQLVQFCKDKAYNYKYGELNPFFAVWKKQQNVKNNTTKGNDSTSDSTSDRDEDEVDWEAFWDEYVDKYRYPPKKAVHLWNFAKEEKFVNVKYKEARHAFDRISAVKVSSSAAPIEGHTRSNTDLGIKSAARLSIASLQDAPEKPGSSKIELDLKITRYTSSTDIESIKESFMELLTRYRRSIRHDPNPLQLFNFINEDTEYKVRYGDVKKCHNYATKHKWFVPMKRMKKVNKKKNFKKGNETAEGSSGSAESAESEESGEGVEFILEVDHEKLKKEKEKEEEEKREVIVLDVMGDRQYDAVLLQYMKKYQNPPRNASQIMNFAHENQQMYKYKACRIAFNRWKNFRGAALPAITQQDDDDDDTEDEQVEPGKGDKVEDDESSQDEENEESD